MIEAGFLLLPDGQIEGFRIAGHGGGEAGTDIVCAAVSSAAYLTANTVTEVLGVTPLCLRADEDGMFLRVKEQDEPLCRTMFQGLRLHLSQLEEQYPEELSVGDIKV